MRLLAAIQGDLKRIVESETRAAQRAIVAGLREAGKGLRDDLKVHTAEADLGKLGRAWAVRVYRGRSALSAAALVYPKGRAARKALWAFEQGAVVRPINGRYLAIPTQFNRKGGRRGGRVLYRPQDLQDTFVVRSRDGNLDGTYTHMFTSGGALPSLALEVGHLALTVPHFARHVGAKAETLSFEMARTGAANAQVGMVAQGESNPAAVADAAPIVHALKRFNQGSGSISLGGAQLANVTGGRLSFSNNLERVETIRSDGLIDGVDETEATAEGTIDVRFGTDTAIRDAVSAETPVALEYTFGIPGSEGYEVVFALPRVFLPKKKQELRGPGGVQASYEWRAAKDATEGHMLQVTLTNDVAGY